MKEKHGNSLASVSSESKSLSSQTFLVLNGRNEMKFYRCRNSNYGNHSALQYFTAGVQIAVISSVLETSSCTKTEAVLLWKRQSSDRH